MVYQDREIVRIGGKATWKVSTTENGWWLGESEELNLVVTARKWTNMVGRMASAVDMLLRDRFGNGELESFVAEHGWSLLNQPTGSPFADGEVFPEDVTFDIPFIFQNRDDSAPTHASP